MVNPFSQSLVVRIWCLLGWFGDFYFSIAIVDRLGFQTLLEVEVGKKLCAAPPSLLCLVGMET
jgi:hypothetical protein